MNYKLVLNTLGRTMLIMAIVSLAPLFVSLIYKEDLYLSYLIPIFAFLLGGGLSFIRPKDMSYYAKEGLVIVALSWIIISLIGALPFVISKSIPSYFDALFETVSGFTTTGASVVANVEGLPKSILFWRSLTHFLGGMGVLVFVLAIIPNSGSGIMHVFRAEAPGPSVGKLVGKVKFTARILYAIYIVLTLLELVLLLIGKMPFFDSVCTALSTAGTGGFGIKNTSIAFYNSVYIEMVIAVFMFIFGINFNLMFLLLIGSFGKAFKSEEFWVYFGIVFLSTIAIAVNILSIVGNFGEAIRYSFFQVTAISSTTGFTTADFDQWPAFSKSILMFLTMFGACAGSTGGGIKIARLGIMFKSGVSDVKKLIKPRTISYANFDGEVLSSDRVRNVRLFFTLWVLIVILSTLLLSIDTHGDLFSNFSASVTCLSNVGPGLGAVGPTQNYGGYSVFSKIIMCLDMLAGRLEIFPMIVLFSPSAWKKR